MPIRILETGCMRHGVVQTYLEVLPQALHVNTKSPAGPDWANPKVVPDGGVQLIAIREKGPMS